MFQKVLVPTDFSRYAAKMTRCIGSMPGVREVVLCISLMPAIP